MLTRGQAREKLNRPRFPSDYENVFFSPALPYRATRNSFDTIARYAASRSTIVCTEGGKTNIALYVPLSSAGRFIAGDADM